MSLPAADSAENPSFGLMNDSFSHFVKDNNVEQKKRGKRKKFSKDLFPDHLHCLLEDVSLLLKNLSKNMAFQQQEPQPQYHQLNYRWTCFQSPNSNQKASGGKSGPPLFFLNFASQSTSTKPPIATAYSYCCRLFHFAPSLTSNYTTTEAAVLAEEESTANQIGVKSSRKSRDEGDGLQLTNTPKRLKKLPLQLSLATTAAAQRQQRQRRREKDKHHLFVSQEEKTGGKLQAAAFDITTTKGHQRKGNGASTGSGEGGGPFDIKMDLDDLQQQQQQSQSQSSGINDDSGIRQGKGRQRQRTNLAAASTTTTLIAAGRSPSGPENGTNFKLAGASETSDAAAAAAAFSVNKRLEETEYDADDERQRRADATNNDEKSKSKDHRFDGVFSLLLPAMGRSNDDDGSDRQPKSDDSTSTSRPPSKSDSLLADSYFSSSFFSSLPILVIYVNDELPPLPPPLPDVLSANALFNRCRQQQLQRQTNDDADAADARAAPFCFILHRRRAQATRTTPEKTKKKKNGAARTTAVKSGADGECSQSPNEKGQKRLTGEDESGENEKILQRLSELKPTKSSQSCQQLLSCNCRPMEDSEKLRWLKSYTTSWNDLDENDQDNNDDDQDSNDFLEEEKNKGSTTTELCLCGLHSGISSFSGRATAAADAAKIGKENERLREEAKERRRRSTETNADCDLSLSSTKQLCTEAENLPANSTHAATAERLQPRTAAVVYPVDRTADRSVGEGNYTKAVRQSFEANERKVKLNIHNQKNKGKNDGREMTVAAAATKSGKRKEQKKNGSPTTTTTIISATDLTATNTTSDQHVSSNKNFLF